MATQNELVAQVLHAHQAVLRFNQLLVEIFERSMLRGEIGREEAARCVEDAYSLCSRSLDGDRSS